MDEKLQPTILVVDDNDGIRELLDKYILSPEGYRVVTASTGREGIERALRESPDLILLDINLPDINGPQVLRELRRLAVQVDVVFITSDDSLMVAIEALRLGVRDYLLKPFQIEEVLDMVRRVLEQRRMEDRARQITRELVTAETIRRTAVALSHRINNDLMTLGGSLVLLRDRLRETGDEEALALVYESLESARRINQTLRHLKKTTSVKIETYDQYTDMIQLGAIGAPKEEMQV